MKKIISKETRKKISNTLKGHKVSEETRIKISKAKKGKKQSKEFIENLRRIRTGWKYSKESKEKMSKNKLLYYKNNPEYKEKLSEAHKGLKHSDESKRKISEAGKGRLAWNKGLKGFGAGENHHWRGKNMSGENNPCWIKDRTKLKKYDDDLKDRRSPAYKDWHKQVFKRDNYICKLKDKKCNGKIEVHHIFGWTKYKDLRFNINNGITLCHAHHPRKWAEEKRLIPVFQELVSVLKVNI